MRTLYYNGRIYSTAAREATAMLVEDSAITWIGHDDGLARHDGVRAVDLAHSFVTPAFVDAHVHVTDIGLSVTSLDLSGCTSLAQALGRIAKASRDRHGRPILGSGWDETRWPEDRPPTNAELDRAAYGGSVYVSRVDGHSAVVSSVLAAAVPGLAALSGYRADGWLSLAAHDAARRVAFSALAPSQIAALQRAALSHAASLGIACVHEMAGPVTSSEQDLVSLLRVAATEPLPEVIAYWGELFGIEAARDLGAMGAGGDLFCDGSLGSHTAALHEPYADDPNTRGSMCYATADLAEHLLRCDAASIQGGFHAIGDAAVDQVLDAVDLVSAKLGHSGGAGHRIEHAEMVRDPARLAASGLLASVQPGFDAAWGGVSGMYADRLGVGRALGLNRFSELAAAGVPLAFGSDAPVTALGPWESVRAAAYPSDSGAALSPRSAFMAHTRAGWRAAGRDDEGVLASGHPATFAVWHTGELGVNAPDDRVSRWSTDPRSAVPGLPDLSPGSELPTCVATVHRGVSLYDTGLLGA